MRGILPVDAQVRILERGVAQSITKGIKRLGRHLDIVLRHGFLVVIHGQLSHGPRHTDRQPSRRVIGPKEHIGNGAAAFLTGIISRQQGIGMLRCPVFQQRTAFDIDDDTRLARPLQSTEQTVLQPQQSQGSAVVALSRLHVAHSVGVGLSRSRLLVTGLEVARAATADTGNDDIRPLGSLHRRGNVVRCRVADGTAFHIAYPAVGQILPHTVEHRLDIALFLRSGVVAKHVIHVVGIRSDKSDLHVLAERKHTVVLQQRDDFLCRHVRYFPILCRPHPFSRLVGIDKRMFKKSHFKFHAQHAGTSRIDSCLGGESTVQSRLQHGIGASAKIHVDTGIERVGCRLSEVACHMMRRLDAVDAVQVRDREAPEAPFFP